MKFKIIIEFVNYLWGYDVCQLQPAGTFGTSSRRGGARKKFFKSTSPLVRSENAAVFTASIRGAVSDDLIGRPPRRSRKNFVFPWAGNARTFGNLVLSVGTNRTFEAISGDCFGPIKTDHQSFSGVPVQPVGPTNCC